MPRLSLIPPAAVLLLLLLTLGGDSAVRGKRPVLGSDTRISAIPIPLDAEDPKRVRAGALRYLGGWELKGRDPAFGSFSAMIAEPDRLTLLNDAGGVVTLRLAARGGIAGVAFGDLPGGPGGSYYKYTRDSESMTRDRTDGRIWIGFEGRNAIYRYDAGLTRVEAGARPAAMRRWPGNGGAEAMVRLGSGRFLVFSERAAGPPGAPEALIFDRDPTDPTAQVARFFYRPPDGFRVTDAAELPDGRLLILHRRLAFWPIASAAVSLLDPRRIAPGEIALGKVIATLEPPLAVDNMEALGVVREGAETIVWIASDDNFRAPFQRNLLLKFALDERAAD